MEPIKIENTTYLVRRAFVGKKTASELIQDRILSANPQVLPLTNGSPLPYNIDGNGFVVRRHNENPN